MSDFFGSLPANTQNVKSCSKWYLYGINPACWKYSLGAWQDMAAYQVPGLPPAPKAQPGDLSTVPTPYTLPEYNTHQEQVISQQNAEWKDQSIQLFENQELVGVEDTGMSWWQVALIGVGVVAAISMVRG